MKLILILAGVCKAPSTSIHRRSLQLNISETSLRRNLHKDFGMTPYKVQLVQELKPIDHSMRFRCAQLCLRSAYRRCRFWQKKSSFQMKLISILAGMLTSKTVAFGARKTRTDTLKSRRTQNESLFCADFGPKE